MEKYIFLSIDQGTTSSRTCDTLIKKEKLKVFQREFKQHFPHPGWVEIMMLMKYGHLFYQLWLEGLMKTNINANQIEGIGITKPT